MFDVVALGELLIDFTCLSVDEAGYPTLAAHPGGAPANFLAALAQYGAKTALIGKVGRDAFGAMLTRTLERAGIDVSGLRAAEDVFTTLAFVTLDGQGNRAFSFARKRRRGKLRKGLFLCQGFCVFHKFSLYNLQVFAGRLLLQKKLDFPFFEM